MSLLDPLLSSIGAFLGTAVVVYFYSRRRKEERRLLSDLTAKEVDALTLDSLELLRRRITRTRRLRMQYEAERLERRLITRVRRSVKAPSFSQWMVRGAVRRLPADMSEAEKTRWGSEMAADVESISGRLRRLRYAFGVWRKGAPKMPVAGAGAPRSAD